MWQIFNCKRMHGRQQKETDQDVSYVLGRSKLTTYRHSTIEVKDDGECGRTLETNTNSERCLLENEKNT